MAKTKIKTKTGSIPIDTLDDDFAPDRPTEKSYSKDYLDRQQKLIEQIKRKNPKARASR